jgi:hypothetical protein
MFSDDGNWEIPGRTGLAENRKAATHLLDLSRPGKPLTRAPFRLSAIHAIELYLNALLLHHGHAHRRVRGMQHDIWMRTECAQATGLRLRKRTTNHLRLLSQNREYLITRYGPEPELAAMASHNNELTATLDELAKKVMVLISQPSILASKSNRAIIASVFGPVA